MLNTCKRQILCLTLCIANEEKPLFSHQSSLTYEPVIDCVVYLDDSKRMKQGMINVINFKTMTTSNTTATTTTTIEMPSILTANTFYWSPSSIASGRRRNEERRQEEVSSFFKALGFEVQAKSDRVVANLPSKKLEVTFDYRETCGHVYKSLSVYRDGKKSNISAIKKLLV